MEEVQKTLSISQNHLSLDAPLTPGRRQQAARLPARHPEPRPRLARPSSTRSPSPSRKCSRTLKEREAKILRLYFGLDGPEPMTLEEIGSLLGITRERVRQIKEKALSRLRHVSRARALESFLA